MSKYIKCVHYSCYLRPRHAVLLATKMKKTKGFTKENNPDIKKHLIIILTQI